MSGVNGAMGIDRVMSLRAQILERNQTLQRAAQTPPAIGTAEPAATPATGFTAQFESALKDVNRSQAHAGELSAAYERGETVDIAKVMLARQQAAVSFEATLQVRNKLLTAYRDIMSMPV